MTRRVVVTGTGVLSPIGESTHEFLNGLRSGANGIGPITSFDTSAFSVHIAGELKINFDDYWADEIATFWVADPELSFNETLNRNYNLNYGVGLFFHLILKHFFRIFGYDLTLGRLVPLFFGFLSFYLH